MDKLITLKELSEILKVPPSTIYSWTHMQFIPHYKLGKSLRFKESDIEKWLQKRYCKGRATRKIDINTIL
ncbi:MAG: helix-turn-helix domain-containing protein [Candidatus Omnitrophica bacterium]|nr:helix-turn-helix domain-containing protein [Candidatus Omnitrophota bacterium]